MIHKSVSLKNLSMITLLWPDPCRQLCLMAEDAGYQGDCTENFIKYFSQIKNGMIKCLNIPKKC